MSRAASAAIVQHCSTPLTHFLAAWLSHGPASSCAHRSTLSSRAESEHRQGAFIRVETRLKPLCWGGASHGEYPPSPRNLVSCAYVRESARLRFAPAFTTSRLQGRSVGSPLAWRTRLPPARERDSPSRHGEGTPSPVLRHPCGSLCPRPNGPALDDKLTLHRSRSLASLSPYNRARGPDRTSTGSAVRQPCHAPQASSHRARRPPRPKRRPRRRGPWLTSGAECRVPALASLPRRPGAASLHSSSGLGPALAVHRGSSGSRVHPLLPRPSAKHRAFVARMAPTASLAPGMAPFGAASALATVSKHGLQRRVLPVPAARVAARSKGVGSVASRSEALTFVRQGCQSGRCPASSSALANSVSPVLREGAAIASALRFGALVRERGEFRKPLEDYSITAKCTNPPARAGRQSARFLR